MFGWMDGMAWRGEWTPSVKDTLQGVVELTLLMLKRSYGRWRFGQIITVVLRENNLPSPAK